jgi:hypothetical protein
MQGEGAVGGRSVQINGGAENSDLSDGSAGDQAQHERIEHLKLLRIQSKGKALAW